MSGLLQASKLMPMMRPLARLAVVAVAAIAGAGATCAQTAPGATQIEQMVAPIALYPDALLAQMLMASTYPREVVEAARWAQANPDVNGETLQEAVQSEQWDPSIKGLTALPQVLQLMTARLDWTQGLGDAFLAQPQSVLDAIQRLRARADAADLLQNTPQQRISRVAAPSASGAPPATVYVIETATPDEYHLPIYDPAVAFGKWPHPGAPSISFFPPGASGTLAFASGVAVGAAIWGRIDWWQHRLTVDLGRFKRFNRTSIRRAWTHDPAHRGDIPYRYGYTERQAEREAEKARESPSTKAVRATKKKKFVARSRKGGKRK